MKQPVASFALPALAVVITVLSAAFLAGAVAAHGLGVIAYAIIYALATGATYSLVSRRERGKLPLVFLVRCLAIALVYVSVMGALGGAVGFITTPDLSSILWQSAGVALLLAVFRVKDKHESDVTTAAQV
jgi:O-antigen/teichoic acid export membrane protein